MTCREMVEFLSAYVDGELPKVQRDVFDEHLRLCPDCVQYVDSFKRTIELGQAICKHDEASLPDEIPDALVRAILHARKTE